MHGQPHIRFKSLFISTNNQFVCGMKARNGSKFVSNNHDKTLILQGTQKIYHPSKKKKRRIFLKYSCQQNLFVKFDTYINTQWYIRHNKILLCLLFYTTISIISFCVCVIYHCIFIYVSKTSEWQTFKKKTHLLLKYLTVATFISVINQLDA